MSQQPMCRTCRSVTVDQSLGVGHQSGGLCANCWEVERRLPGYLRHARGLRIVMALVQQELNDEAHLRDI